MDTNVVTLPVHKLAPARRPTTPSVNLAIPVDTLAALRARLVQLQAVADVGITMIDWVASYGEAETLAALFDVLDAGRRLIENVSPVPEAATQTSA